MCVYHCMLKGLFNDISCNHATQTIITEGYDYIVLISSGKAGPAPQQHWFSHTRRICSAAAVLVCGHLQLWPFSVTKEACCPVRRLRVIANPWSGIVTGMGNPSHPSANLPATVQPIADLLQQVADSTNKNCRDCIRQEPVAVLTQDGNGAHTHHLWVTPL